MKKYTIVKASAITGKSKNMIFRSCAPNVLNVISEDRLENVGKLVNEGFIQEATPEEIKAFDEFKNPGSKKKASSVSEKTKPTKSAKDDNKSGKNDS